MGLGKISKFWRQTLILFTFLVCCFVTWCALLAGNPIEQHLRHFSAWCACGLIQTTPDSANKAKQGGKAARRHDTGLGQLYGWCCFPNWKHDPHNDLERRNIHYDDYPGSVVTSCDFIVWAFMSYELWVRGLKKSQAWTRSSKSISLKHLPYHPRDCLHPNCISVFHSGMPLL